MNEQIYNYIIQRLENKLREYMDAEEYSIFLTKVAQDSFKHEVESLPECDYKDFCKANLGDIFDVVFQDEEVSK